VVLAPAGSRISPEDRLPSLALLDAVLKRYVFGYASSVGGYSNSNILLPYTFSAQIPLSEVLGLLLPSTVCEYLILRYFTYQALLFNVVYGLTFRK
jgi:hypothetical protein